MTCLPYCVVADQVGGAAVQLTVVDDPYEPWVTAFSNSDWIKFIIVKVKGKETCENDSCKTISYKFSKKLIIGPHMGPSYNEVVLLMRMLSTF